MARKNQRSVKAGKKYGKLTPIEKVIITDPYRKTLWKCECECGNTILKSGQYLLNSKNPNCGCVPLYPIPDDVLAMVGKTYGELTVLYVKKEEKKRPMAVCECSCGKIFETKAYTLKNGRTKSCGHENLKNLEKGYKIQEIARVSNTNITSIIDRKKNKNNSTGYKGVSTLESGKFRAYIYFQRKQYHLGSFENLEDAIKAREKAEENIYGNFLNWYAEAYPEKWEIINKNKIEMKKSSNKRTERSLLVRNLEIKIARDIECGKIKPGTKILPQRELKEVYGNKSASIINEVIKNLKKKNLIISIQGKGKYVRYTRDKRK